MCAQAAAAPPDQVEAALLEQFAPRLSPDAVPAPESLQMDLDGRAVRLRDISARGRAILRPLLLEWVQLAVSAGPVLSCAILRRGRHCSVHVLAGAGSQRPPRAAALT